MTSPAESTSRARPKSRPKFGIVVVIALLFRFGRDVIERVAFGRYGFLGFVAVVLGGIALLTLWRLVQRSQAKKRGAVFTPESVRAQVAQSGFDGPAFEEDGTLLGASLLVFDQHPKVIEVLTEYEVFDATGSRLGFVHQVNQSQWKKVVRFVLPIDQFLTHRFDITNADDVPIMRIVRPAKIFLTKLRVFRDDVHVGTIRQRNVFWKIRFDIDNAVGHTIGHLRADNVRAWDFSIVDAMERPMAKVFKTWEGWTRAAFTRADHYVVRIEHSVDDPMRSLTIAAALAIDLGLKQDNRR